MTPDPTNVTDEHAIWTLMADSATAIRARDIDGSLAAWSPDAVSFDVVNPLRFAGLATVNERLGQWFAGFDGSIGFETRDLTVTVGGAGGDVAFCHGLNHVSATTTDGRPLDMWWRATTCFRKIAGAWTVTHAHSSVPMDITSGQASVGLKP